MANFLGNVREDCNPEVPIGNVMLFVRRDAEKLWVGVRRRDKTMDKGVKRDRQPGRMFMSANNKFFMPNNNMTYNKANDASSCLIE